MPLENKPNHKNPNKKSQNPSSQPARPNKSSINEKKSWDSRSSNEEIDRNL